MSRARRPDADLIASAKEMARYVPSLRPLKKRKRLKKWERSKITRYERALKGSYNLEPLTAKQARALRDVVYTGNIEIKRGPRKGQHREVRGIAAIQLANTGEKVKINVTENRDMFITTNGRTWVYWQLDQLGEKEYEQYLDECYDEDEARELIQEDNTATVREAGKRAFTGSVREAFPVEKIVRLAEKAFKKPAVRMIGLWTSKGRVGEGFHNFDEFKQWIRASYSTYANVEKWVNGIAILIADAGEVLNQNVWSRRSVQEIETARKKRRSKYRVEQRRRKLK